MKKALLYLSMLFSIQVYAQEKNCAHWLALFKPACQRVNQVWTEGYNELYLSGYAWHNRFTYSDEKIKKYNEAAWGGGMGKGLFDEKGNWHGLYAFAFLDSHTELEPALGYAYLKVANFNQDLKVGLGYTVLVTARSDTNHYLPFPGILPWTSLFFKKVTVAATYIPGFNHNGNVLYLLGKYRF